MNVLDMEALATEMTSDAARPGKNNICKDTVYAIEIV
jgi:hypothetical protein